MDFPGIIFWIVIISLCIYTGINIQFGKIAESKGYNKTLWTIASMFLALPVWLLIIAMPNIKQHQELLAALSKLESKTTEASTQVFTQPDTPPDFKTKKILHLYPY